MVAAPVVLVLIAGNAVVKCDLAGQATFGEVAVDGFFIISGNNFRVR